MALYYPLTGFSHRALLTNRLEQAINPNQRPNNYIFIILYLNYNRCKIVKDSLGNSTGDKLLIALADRLKSCLRSPVDTYIA